MRNPRLRAIAEDIDRLLSIERFELDSDDVRELAEVVLALVAAVVDIPGLETRMLEGTRVNFDRVEKAISCFESAKTARGALDVEDTLAELRRLLPDRRQDGAARLGAHRAVATGQMFEDLLIYTDGADLEAFEALLTKIFVDMDDVDLSNILGSAKTECSPEALNGSTAGGADVLEFMQTHDLPRERELLPPFLTRHRPRLQWKKIDAGDAIPCEVSLGAILAAERPTPPAPLDQRMSRCLVHVFGLFTAIQGTPRAFASRLGLEEESYFQVSHEMDLRYWRWGKARPDNLQSSLLVWLRRLTSYADAHIDWASPVEATMRAYKLGLEVQWIPKHPSASDLDKTWHEDRFQRHAVRFLLERNVPACGTKLGSYEQDFVAGDPDERLVVEVKIYKKAAGAARLGQNIGQLLQYLDQQDPGRRGVLCIYNFSAVPMIAPPLWIGNQYMILVINLCSVTPSQAKKRRSILPRAGTHLAVDVEDI